MLKVNVSEDCGNAPKKAQLRDFNIAFAKNDLEQVLENLTDNIRWMVVGDQLLEGKESVAKMLEQTGKSKATELTINNVITHGNVGAVDGILILEDGSSYAYCDVCRFSSHAKDAKIKEITSYVIKI